MRKLLLQYVDARLEVHRSAYDMVKAEGLLAEAERLQRLIWSGAVAACQADPKPSTTMLVLPALNAMFDIATTRLMATRMHPPTIIFVLLIALCLICAFLAGNGLAVEKPNRLHALGFSLVIAFTVYVILDMEYPRLGFIRVDAADQVLYDLRATMGPVTAQ